MAQSKDDLIALARRSAASAGIPADIIPVFLGQIEQESNWNPRAVSKAGARGLGQLMPGTARELGVKDPFDPVENLRGAANYFKSQLDRFGDVGLALAAYNWGPGNANKLVNNPRSVRIPKETQEYVPKVLSKALNYGGALAPSNTTLAFFPASADVVPQAVKRGVDFRMGKADPTQIDRQIATGVMPTGEPIRATGAPARGEPVGAQISDFPMAEATQAAPPEQIAATSYSIAGDANNIARVQSYDDFLRSRFGPLASVADPFPKSYDDDLMSMIDQA